MRQSKGLRLAAVTAAALVLAGCGGVDITYNGGAVTNGEDLLVALERSFRADLADEETPANVHEDAGCYFGFHRRREDHRRRVLRSGAAPIREQEQAV